jgi:outer membrane protein assembly factor BamB
MFRRVFQSILAITALSSVAQAEDWPGWRGPRGDGTSTEKDLPIRWSSTENINWKTPIPGKGHSSPIIHGDRIFVTSCLEQEEKRMLLCLDRRNGKLLWQREVLESKLERKHALNSFASSTPVTDGRQVWVTFLQYPRMQVVCYDYEGNEVWRRSPGEFHSVHGFCTCPVLYKDLLILNGDQDAEAWIVALDKNTGAEKWRIDRPNRTRSYCTPIIVDAAGKKQMVLSGSKCIASYDPDTGKQIWIIDGPTEQFVASLVLLDDILFMTAGFPTYHLMGIRPDGMGNVTNTHVLWHDTRSADYVPSPIAHDKYFYWVNDNGVAGCVLARTGERMWTERMGKHHSASPVEAEGRLYFLADDGVMYVLKSGPKFEVIQRNKLGEECYASPAISHGKIFIRGANNLYCIGKSGDAGIPTRSANTP